MIRLIIIAVGSFMARSTKFNFLTLELSNLGHLTQSSSPMQYAEVGQLEVNSNKVMCHLSCVICSFLHVRNQGNLTTSCRPKEN